MQLLFFTGKGGVGKTTVSLAYALARARTGERVLLCLLAPTPSLEALFATTFDHRPCTVRRNLDIMLVNARNSLQEYLSLQLHMKKLIKVMTHNTLVTHFLDAVPGLTEILLLGKVYDLAKSNFRNAGGRRYDLIVVDAPATGHGLSLLQVPMVIRAAVKAGPLKTQSEKMIELFSDHDLCRLCLVTLAEDMPVEETIDFAKKMKQGFYLALGPVFVNAMLEPLPKTTPFPDTPSFNAARLYEKRLTIQAHYRGVLAKYFDELVELPFLATAEIGLPEIEQLGAVACR